MNNAYFVRPGTNWMWGDNSYLGRSAVYGFLDTYRSKTGDTSSQLNPIGSDTQNIAGFTDLFGGVFRLAATSPAIGAGNGNSCPAVDRDGYPRSKDGRCDIGAYAAGNK
jgi:hypothetical protein